MKICFLAAYPPMSDTTGYYTRRLEIYLKKLGAEISLILPCPFRLKDAKIEYTYLGLVNFRETFRFLKKSSPDIIHMVYGIHNYLSTTFHLWLILIFHSKILKIPVFVTIQEASTWIQKLGYIARLYYKLMSYFVDIFLVHTNTSKQELISKCKVVPTKVFHMLHGFYEIERDISHLERLRTECGITEKDKVVLFFGLIRPAKGIENLIEATKIIKDRNMMSNIIVLIVGDVRKREGMINKFFQKKDERYYDYLVKLAKDYSLQNIVKFKRGYVPDDEVFSVFNLCDVVALPYARAEESGVLNIALSVPKPVVTTNISGIGETLQDIGVLVPPESPDKIATALVKVLSDTDFRDNLVKKYISLYDSLNPMAIAKSHYELYKEHCKR